MRWPLQVVLSLFLVAAWVPFAASAQAFTFDTQPGSLRLVKTGSCWLETVTIPFDPARAEETYKVYTHIYDYEGKAPITKGPGGKYTHHRGMFIGWNKTHVGETLCDTWHMKECYQQLEKWVSVEPGDAQAVQVAAIDWCDLAGKPFIKETRRILATNGDDSIRIFDFQSTLTATSQPIQLRGDLQHAGMQVRMDNEVSEHEDTTQYILPEGAEELDDDKVVGAWWVCCSPVVRGTRYWLIHMTPQTNPTGQPVYSIRRYARFGAFIEPDLEVGKPLELNFRVLLSDKELTREACQSLYDAFSAK